MSNVIDIPGGVASGTDVMESYYNMWRDFYAAPTSGTASTIIVGKDLSKLLVKVPVNYVPPKNAIPPKTVSGMDWDYKQYLQEIAPKAPVQAATFKAYQAEVAGVDGNASTLGFTIGSIAYNGAIFAGVGGAYFNSVSSTDFLNWAAHAAVEGATGYIPGRGIFWTGARWLFSINKFGGADNGIYRSTDLSGWVRVLDSTGYTVSFTFVSNGSVIVGHHSSGSYVLSTDGGLTWSAIRFNGTASSQTIPVWDGTYFIALGSLTSAPVGLRSLDGNPSPTYWETFTAPAINLVMPYGYNPSATSSNAILASPTAAQNFLYRSTDHGDSWAVVSLPTTRAWGAGCFGGGRILLSDNNSNTDDYITSDDEGLTWALKHFPVAAYWGVVLHEAATWYICGYIPGTGSVTYLSTDNGNTWTNAIAGVPAIMITRADIDAFNLLHAGDGITAQFGPTSDALPVARPADGPTAPARLMALNDVAFTMFYDGLGRFYDFISNQWTYSQSSNCRFSLTDFPYTLDGIASAAVDSSPYRAVISESYREGMGPIAAVWAKSKTSDISVALYHAGTLFDFGGGKYWTAMDRYTDNGLDGSYSIQQSVMAWVDRLIDGVIYHNYEEQTFFTWDAANLSVVFEYPGVLWPLQQVVWIYLTPKGKLAAISNRHLDNNSGEYGVYNFYDHLGNEFPRFQAENIILFEISVADEHPLYRDHDFIVKTWEPAATSAPALFYSAIDFPEEYVSDWQAYISTQGNYVDGAPAPPIDLVPSMPTSGPLSITSAPVVADGVTVLAGGSYDALTSPPTIIAVGGSLDELTAPPLPFNSGAGLVEHTSPVTLPLADISAGGTILHTGLPFTMGD